MSLKIRVDDFPGTKIQEFDRHNLESFKRFHHHLTRYDDFSYILGVIPGYTSFKDLRWLLDQENIQIALHGVTHSELHLDEFEGFCYRDTETALFAAKNFLEGPSNTRVADYIPPHNTLNSDTVLALSRLGFERIYGGPETEEVMKDLIKLEGMDYVHSESPLEYGRSDELLARGAVEHLTRESKVRDVCLTLHSPWEINIGLDNLNLLMLQLHDNNVF